MNDNTTPIDKSKEVDFSYPEGFQEAVASLDFLPEDVAAQMLAVLATGMLQ